MPRNIPDRQPRSFPGSSFRYTPLEHVRTVLVGFVQGLFAAAPPGEYHWTPNDETTEIIIRDENTVHAEKLGARPAVNFSRGNIQFYSVGMDDLMEYDWHDGRKIKGVLIPGVTSINVSSRSDIEADNLAWVIAEYLWVLREDLLKAGFFEFGRGITIAPPSAPGSIIQGDQGEEWYCTTVSVPWQFARRSAFTPLGMEIVQSIKTNIQTNGPRHIESQGWPSADHELPYNVHECPPEPFSSASDAHGGTPDAGGFKSNPLPRVPHPLDPSKMVVVRSVKPHRAGLRGNTRPASGLPFDGSCVKKSEGTS